MPLYRLGGGLCGSWFDLVTQEWGGSLDWRGPSETLCRENTFVWEVAVLESAVSEVASVCAATGEGALAGGVLEMDFFMRCCLQPVPFFPMVT